MNLKSNYSYQKRLISIIEGIIYLKLSILQRINLLNNNVLFEKQIFCLIIKIYNSIIWM